MTVLDNFTEEILQSELPKNVLLHNMIRGLDKEKPPQFEVPAKSIRLSPICTVFLTIISIVRLPYRTR